MKLASLLEAAASPKRLVVIYGGRFQPFHKGHFAAYTWLCDKFGPGNVWLATSNKTNFSSESDDVSPLNFKEKRQLITTLYDVPPRRIVKCNNPAFSPMEIMRLYHAYEPIYVAAVGTKDGERYSEGDLFRPLPDRTTGQDYDFLKPLSAERAYFVTIPMQDEKLSGTEVRQAFLNDLDGDHEKLFKQFFGKYDPLIDDLLTAKLKDVK